MARSVYVPSRAANVVYASFEDDADYWEDAIDNVAYDLMAKYPSLEKPSSPRWVGREGRVILENKLVSVVVSEYCGLVALSVVVEWAYESFGYQFANKMDLDAVAGYFGRQLLAGGRFSNGEQMFVAKQGKNPGALGLGFSSKEGWL